MALVALEQIRKLRLSSVKTPHNQLQGELCSVSHPCVHPNPHLSAYTQQVMQRAAFLWCSWQAARCALLTAMQWSEEPVVIIPFS